MIPALVPMMRSGDERGDPLEVEAVDRSQHLRLGAAQLVGRPRPGGVFESAVPLSDCNGNDAKGEQGVLLGQPDADNSFGHPSISVTPNSCSTRITVSSAAAAAATVVGATRAVRAVADTATLSGCDRKSVHRGA